ncbi:MAG: AAA family ATPase [Sterolibacteriaceae bacterium]|nr:AAA family ATPase [Sterolibacteriaceae bacterium]MBK9087364.1 AAA family ATPase [Sterolibacteriaceae bacterium]
MLEALQQMLAANQFAAGGLLLGALGLLAVWMRDIPGKFAGWARHFIVTSLAFDNRDELMFATLVEYMNAKDVLRRINNFTVRGVRQTESYTSLADELQQGGRPQPYLSPGEGFHIFMLDGRLMWMKREIQVATSILEKITLSTFGRSKAPLEAFIHAAMDARMARELNKIAIYIPSSYTNEWSRARLGNNRKLASIVLKSGQKEAILDDLNRFFASRLRYEDLGIPWRRGYLLFGPPGTGKTSLVTALASELMLNVCSLSLASPNVSDEKIGNLLSTVPARSIVLLEDIDSFFRRREKADASIKLSYSGFINALDGVASHEGSVIFLTTNHPELIDEAAIRSGRVDFRMELTNCDTHQLERMFLKFFADADAARRFAAATPAGRWSPAQVQERLLKSHSVDEALAQFEA